MIKELNFRTNRQGLLEITDQVIGTVNSSNCRAGICNLFIQHTSASLIIQENADPSAKKDLETWINRLIPENDPSYTHTYEGPDDMPAHLKSAITNSSLTIPIQNGNLMLGKWQGIYIWEHRCQGSLRKVVLTIQSLS